jgi:hypothetical protein
MNNAFDVEELGRRTDSQVDQCDARRHSIAPTNEIRLTINIKAAKVLGLTIPPSLLAAARTS